MSADWYVEIVTHAVPNEVVKRLGPMTEGKAERCERGVNINLDHEHYHTRLVSESGGLGQVDLLSQP